MKITAKGIKNKKNLEVVVENIPESRFLRYLFDGKRNGKLEDELEQEIEKCHPIGGTYYPELGSQLSIISALEGPWFFDRSPQEIEIEGLTEEIPVEGKIN